MIGFFAQPNRRLFLLRTALPILATALALNVAEMLLLAWATIETDRSSVDRQQSLVDLIVSQLRSSVAHDQESATVWDDAVEAVRRDDSAEWIDDNLGSWMASYFGHDGAYIVDPANDPVFVFADNAVQEAAAFQQVRTQVMPLIEDLRARLRAGETEGLSDQILTLGAADIAVMSGRPAIVSVKPIVSDSGEIEQTAGEEYLHIAVRYLDGSLVADLENEYLLDGVRFSRDDHLQRYEAAAPLRSADGLTIGYLIWQPFRPGLHVLWRVAPAMAALSLGSMAALGLFIAALRKRSLKLSFSEAAVRHIAEHDLLTGLANRDQFRVRLDQALKGLPADHVLGVLELDLDHFKEVNDSLGHPAGDELLREFADRLRRLTNEGDAIARMGGDEFLMMVRARSQDEVEDKCRAIVETARHPFDLPGNQVFVGVSIGAALAPRDGRDRVELARRADVALYQAKRSGRSGYAIYSGEMDQAAKARRELEQDLRKALETESQLQIHYQPLLNVKDGSISGAEALIRWEHPTKGSIPPTVSIPVAEETGLIESLGHWVLREACRQAVDWPIATLAVNVSVMELQQPSYALRVANLLLDTGMDPRRLELEVTESAFSERATACERNIMALRELGVRFALDDFGTGFSSLGRLHRIAVDRLKIDRSFVKGLGRERGDEAIVEAIVHLAKAVGLKVTAEGVESPQQRDYLSAIGCDELQGFLIAEPMSADLFGERLCGKTLGRDELVA